MRPLQAEKFKVLFHFVIRLSILFGIWGAIVNRNWMVLFISVLTLILTFLPAIIERNIKISLPAELEMLIVVFIYTALFLGEVKDYYTRLWWWDVFLHGMSGVALGFAGFLLLFFLYDGKKLRAKPITICMLAFCFSLAIGALWEVFEFTMDSAFGLNMQKNGLHDTMWDLIVDSLGALFTSLVGFLYLKTGKSRLFDRLVARFVNENRRIYGRKSP